MKRFKRLCLAVVAAGMTGSEAADVTPGATDGATYGNWTVKCEQADDAPDSCFIFQNLVLREGGQRVLQLAVGYVPAAVEPIALLSLPLGISLPPGVSISIDDGEATRFAIERCEPNGCRAGLKLKAPLVAEISAGERILIKFFDAQREAIEVPLSLQGFATGLAAVRTTSDDSTAAQGSAAP